MGDSERFPLSEASIEAAAKALNERYGRIGILSRAVVCRHPTPQELSLTVLRAALDAMGAKVERTAEYQRGKLSIPHHVYVNRGPETEEPWEEVDPLVRLVTDWQPEDSE